MTLQPMTGPVEAARLRLFRMFGSDFVIGVNTRSRTHAIIRCRWVAMAFLRERGFSTAECAAVLGLASHTSVCKGMKHVAPRNEWGLDARSVYEDFDRSFREGLAWVPELGVARGVDLYSQMAWQEVSNGQAGRGRSKAARTKGDLPEVRVADSE